MRSGFIDDRAASGSGLDILAEPGAPDDTFRFRLPGEPYPRVIIDTDLGGAGAVLTGSGSAPPTVITGGGSLVTSVAGRIGPVVLDEADITGLVADLLTLTNGAVAATTAINARALASRLVSAGAGLSGGGSLAADRTISMPNVGTPGTYGDATHIPQLVLDAQGRVAGITLIPVVASVPIPFSKGGFISDGPLHGIWPVTNPFHIAKAKAVLETAPVGGNATFDILWVAAGAPIPSDPSTAPSIWNVTPSNRPTILDSSNPALADSGVPDKTAFVENDILIPWIVSTGSPSTEGSDLLLSVITTP